MADDEDPPKEDAEPEADPCSVEHPDLVKCGALGPAYEYDSEDEACKAACGRAAKATKKAPSYNGPCVDQGGYHYLCKTGNKYCGHTASCCPCCEASDGAAVQRTLCRHN